ncbi:transglycosylase [Brucella inopinata]|nr:transglycosylase [Brucella inopinata]
MLVGCAVALSACNTTNDGNAVKTALITQTDNKAVSGEQPSSAPLAAASDEAAPQTQTVASLPDPVLPDVVPIPGIRGQSEPMMAYAGAQAAASPASIAANMAFETPDSAPKDLDALITKYSVAYDVPERLVRRVVHRESRFNPGARNGPYWGLMQISHPTARGMGYTGSAKGLLDAETNLKYAVRYLSGAYKVAGGDESQAVRYYARGYYYDAKRKGLLQETGLDGSWKRNGPTREAAASIQPASLPEGAAVPIPGVAPIQASYAAAGQ